MEPARIQVQVRVAAGRGVGAGRGAGRAVVVGRQEEGRAWRKEGWQCRPVGASGWWR